MNPAIDESPASRDGVGVQWSTPALGRQVVRLYGYFLFFVWLWFVIVFDSTAARLILHFLYGAFFLGYCVHLVVRRRLPGPTPLDLPLAALVLVHAAAILASPYGAIGVESSLAIVAAAVFLYALNDLRFFTLEALVRLLLLVMFVLALRGLISVAGLYLEDLRLLSAVQGGLSPGDLVPDTVQRARDLHHPTVLGMLLTPSLPFALALVLRPSGRLERALAATALSIGLVALFFTASRGSWLACIAAVPAFFLVYVPSGPGYSIVSQLKAFVCKHARLLLAGAVLSAAVGLLAAASLWGSRPDWLFRDTAAPRIEMALVSIEIIGDRPLLGFGPDSYGLLYFAYGGQDTNGVWPHNMYLDVATGVGLVGLAGFAAVGFSVVTVLRRAVRQQDPCRRALAAACVAALVTPLVGGLFEAPFHQGSVLLLLGIVFVIALRLAPAQPPRRDFVSLAPRVMVLALIPIMLFAWATTDVTSMKFSRSLAALEEARLADAATSARDAAKAEPSSVAYQLHAGVVQALVYQEQLAAGAPDPGALEGAVGYLRRAAELDPNGFLAYANLAQALRLQDDAPAAVEAARRSLALSPRDYGVPRWWVDATIAAAAGSVLEWAGYTDEAVEAYAVALHLEPTLSQSIFWSTTPARQALRPRVIEASGLSSCELGRYAALYGSDGDGLRRLAAACRASLRGAADRAALAMMLEAGGEHKEALRQAGDALRASRGSPGAHTALGFVLAAHDVKKARREFLSGDRDAPLLLALTYESNPAAASGPPPEVLRNLEPLSSESQFSLADPYYFAGLRRWAPPVTLIPGDWLLLESPRALWADAILARYAPEDDSP